MKIFKTLFVKPVPNRVFIHPSVSSPYSEQLEQAKGVMNNYLRDKNFTVSFYNDVFDFKKINVIASNNSKTALSMISFVKDDKKPFLRKAYEAIEKFANDEQFKKMIILQK